ncbi:MAG TPA: hypothetical protein VEZ88_02930 [Steroidobacteraceae bacterium]|nr:hypothetical protein [Steroidobacteraceae bacterium]
MLSDWLRIMLDEIARKQTQLENARAEQQSRELDRARAPPEPARKAGRRARGAPERRP